MISQQTGAGIARRVRRESTTLAGSMRSRQASDAALRGFVALCLLFLFLPVVLVILFSFSARAVAAFPFAGPSLRWYREAFDNDVIVTALLTSAKLAVFSSLAGTTVGATAALGLVRARRAIGVVCTALIALPLVFPSLIVGISLATALVFAGIKLSLWTALLGHTVLVLPLCFIVVAARLARFDWSVEEASRDLGAGPFYTFRHVIFPAIGPALIGAMAIAMAFSLDEFVVTFFTIGIDNTLPIVLWSRMRTTLDPSINALGTVILAGTMFLTALAARFGGVKL